MYKAAVLETENDLLWFDPHCYLLYCTCAPVAARLSFRMSNTPKACQNDLGMSKGPCESAILTTSRSTLHGSCAWDGKRSSLLCSSSLSALLHVRACSRTFSVSLCQKHLEHVKSDLEYFKSIYEKDPHWPQVVAFYKTAILETKNDLLWSVPHRYLLYCVVAPVAASPQCSYVKRYLHYVTRDLHVNRTIRKGPSAYQSSKVVTR